MKSIFLVLAGLVVGVAVGFVLGEQQTETPLLSGSQVEDTSAERPSPEIPRRRNDPVPTENSSNDQLSALIAEAEVPDLPAKRGEIKGRVTDKLGAGIPGIDFVLSAEYKRPTTKAGGDDGPATDLRSRVVSFLSSIARVEATTFRTTSQADGNFVFKSVPDLNYDIRGDTKDYRFHRKESGTVSLGSHCEFEAEAQGRLQVQVLDADGRSPLVATIICKEGPDSGGRPFRWSPDSSEIRIPLGKWQVYAQIGERRNEVETLSVEIEIIQGEEAQHLTLAVDAGRPRIFGKVIVDTDIPFIGSVYLFKGTSLDAVSMGDRHRQRPIHVGENQGFNFEFKDQDPGDYLLALWLGGRAIGAPELLHAISYKGGAVEQDFQYKRPKDEDTIQVRVLDPHGEAYGNDNLRFMLRTSHSSGPVPLMWPRGKGLFAVVVGKHSPTQDARDSSGNMVLTASVSSDREVKGSVAFVHGQSEELLLRLVKPEAYGIQVNGIDSSRGNYKIIFGDSNAGGGFSQDSEITLDENGRATDVMLRPGALSYYLSVDKGTSAFSGARIAFETITIQPGRDLVLDAPKLFDLVVIAKSEDQIYIDLDPRILGGRRAVCDIEGKCEIKNLPRGRCTVWSPRLGKNAAKTIDINGNATIEF